MTRPCWEEDDVDDGHVLWRRVQDHLDHHTWDSRDQRFRPITTHPSNSLQFDDDGMSSSWSEHLVQVHNLGPEAILDDARKYTLVYAFSTAAARTMKCSVTHTPDTDDPVIGCAHCSVRYPTEAIDRGMKKEVRYQLAQAMELVHGEPTIEIPPGA